MTGFQQSCVVRCALCVVRCALCVVRCAFVAVWVCLGFVLSLSWVCLGFVLGLSWVCLEFVLSNTDRLPVLSISEGLRVFAI